MVTPAGYPSTCPSARAPECRIPDRGSHAAWWKSPGDLSSLLDRRPEMARRIEYTGFDIDPDVLVEAQNHLSGRRLRTMEFIRGDALEAESPGAGRYDLIVSTGLGEFLNGIQLMTFYGNVYRALRAGGVFFTSASARDPVSDYLLRAFEFETLYRDAPEWNRLLRAVPWSDVRPGSDPTGL